jgi:CheY-like chemotaxis protein
MSAPEPRALVVEEDAALRRPLVRILQRIGFSVATSESGAEALERGCAESAPPNVRPKHRV